MITPKQGEASLDYPDLSEITNEAELATKGNQMETEGKSEGKENVEPVVSFRSPNKSQGFIKKQEMKEEKVTEKKTKMASKKKIVIIEQKQMMGKSSDTTPKLLTKISSNAHLSSKSIERAPSLKKIKRMPSCDQNFESDKLEQTGSSLFKKVKFEEINCDHVGESKDQSVVEDDSNVNFNSFYQKLILEEEDCNQNKPKETFMSFICSLFTSKSKRQNTKTELRLMKLNNKKISGTREEALMLKAILHKLLHQQIEVQNENEIESEKWKQIGFASSNPFNQFQDGDVLTLLQWFNFISSHEMKAIKFANQCIELACSLYKFHKEASKMFCHQLKKCRIKAKHWDSYQEHYNAFVLQAIKQIELKVKQSIENMDKNMIDIVQKCSKNIDQAFNSMKKPKKGSLKK